MNQGCSVFQGRPRGPDVFLTKVPEEVGGGFCPSTFPQEIKAGRKNVTKSEKVTK